MKGLIQAILFLSALLFVSITAIFLREVKKELEMQALLVARCTAFEMSHIVRILDESGADYVKNPSDLDVVFLNNFEDEKARGVSFIEVNSTSFKVSVEYGIDFYGLSLLKGKVISRKVPWYK